MIPTMDAEMDAEADAHAFEAHRAALASIAYRMLGSASEADDVVQDAWLRWQVTPHEEVRSARAYLSKVVTRLCLDRLKSARAQRETYVGPWLPEPVRTATEDEPLARAESISLAFLVLLESLGPLERAVYLLHEIFDYSHAEVAEIVGKGEATCRQILHRARKAVAARRPRFAPSKEAHHRMLDAFAAACASTDPAAIEGLLAEEITSWGDGGGKAAASRRPLHGRHDVARAWAGFYRKAPPGTSVVVEEINGWPALVIRIDGRIAGVISLETDGERIFALRSVVNPDKLARL
jgi:RNA polymerase sigma-70 factor (ECF subfamily)